MLLVHLASVLVSCSSSIYPAAGPTGEAGGSDFRENVCPVCVCVGWGLSKKNKQDMCSAQSASLALRDQSPASSDTHLPCDCKQVPSFSEPWLPLLKHKKDGAEHPRLWLEKRGFGGNSPS